jgi:hypothetical protein
MHRLITIPISPATRRVVYSHILGRKDILPYPALCYDPRTVDPTSIESLRAKCVVVEERTALLGSANFTDRGQSRNVEVGAIIEDEGFAVALASRWRSATAAGAFVAYRG